ncbi:hypothetical protein [Candidatus Nitrososphaera evergladensis]|nr:hypothetical protein [Candidatus Nitrososphaera evergladensis]
MSTCEKCTCKTATSLIEYEEGGKRAFQYNGKLFCQECYLEILRINESRPAEMLLLQASS